MDKIEVPQVDSTHQKTKVKVCGVTKPQDAVIAAKSGAAFIGMIFAKSPRMLGIPEASRIIKSVKELYPEEIANSRIPKSDPSLYNFNLESENKRWFKDYIRKIDEFGCARPLFVGVFSNQSLEYILEVCSAVDLDFVQLHGDESFDMPLSIPVPVIKVFQVGSDFNPPEFINRGGNHALILLDTKVEGASVQGGHGVSFDWNVAKQVSQDKDIELILAGGLTHHNVSQSVKVGLPWCVDVSSGVETHIKGEKDHEKVKEFIANAHSTI
ncbi:Multifunctional tryptophan biosynthesis protein [Smittium mucronatum]|uniref:N-(5'-phosphoribosyl)anthranilate isomerase n=1 Tax=Smittium mucronatum TaxID=133383 RepID=A0A1R0GQ75_9FUNG|nr:Multifunctional tryptophan biosynthesis protein [Smittium mucronatum]